MAFDPLPQTQLNIFLFTAEYTVPVLASINGWYSVHCYKNELKKRFNRQSLIGQVFNPLGFNF
jgi:hypothetical protein